MSRLDDAARNRLGSAAEVEMDIEIEYCSR
jgi:hypothetical protein